MKNLLLIAFASCFALAQAYCQSPQSDLRHQILSTEGENPHIAAQTAGNNLQYAKKNPLLAVCYSLLLPGMGELYAGRFDVGRYSLIGEGALWLTYASYVHYGNWLRGDARQFAVDHSGANPAGKDDNFYVNLATYNSVYDYNEHQLQSRNITELYDPAQGYYWNWDSDNDRNQFHELRISSDRVINNSKFVIAVIVVNHLVSAVNAARLVRKFNRSLDEELGAWEVTSSLLGGYRQPDGIQLTFERRF